MVKIVSKELYNKLQLKDLHRKYVLLLLYNSITINKYNTSNLSEKF